MADLRDIKKSRQSNCGDRIILLNTINDTSVSDCSSLSTNASEVLNEHEGKCTIAISNLRQRQEYLPVSSSFMDSLSHSHRGGASPDAVARYAAILDFKAPMKTCGPSSQVKALSGCDATGINESQGMKDKRSISDMTGKVGAFHPTTNSHCGMGSSHFHNRTQYGTLKMHGTRNGRNTLMRDENSSWIDSPFIHRTKYWRRETPKPVPLTNTGKTRNDDKDAPCEAFTAVKPPPSKDSSQGQPAMTNCPHCQLSSSTKTIPLLVFKGKLKNPTLHKDFAELLENRQEVKDGQKNLSQATPTDVKSRQKAPTEGQFKINQNNPKRCNATHSSVTTEKNGQAQSTQQKKDMVKDERPVMLSGFKAAISLTRHHSDLRSARRARSGQGRWVQRSKSDIEDRTSESTESASTSISSSSCQSARSTTLKRSMPSTPTYTRRSKKLTIQRRSEAEEYITSSDDTDGTSTLSDGHGQKVSSKKSLPQSKLKSPEKLWMSKRHRSFLGHSRWISAQDKKTPTLKVKYKAPSAWEPRSAKPLTSPKILTKKADLQCISSTKSSKHTVRRLHSKKLLRIHPSHASLDGDSKKVLCGKADTDSRVKSKPWMKARKHSCGEGKMAAHDQFKRERFHRSVTENSGLAAKSSLSSPDSSKPVRRPESLHREETREASQKSAEPNSEHYCNEPHRLSSWEEQVALRPPPRENCTRVQKKSLSMRDNEIDVPRCSKHEHEKGIMTIKRSATVNMLKRILQALEPKTSEEDQKHVNPTLEKMRNRSVNLDKSSSAVESCELLLSDVEKQFQIQAEHQCREAYTTTNKMQPCTAAPESSGIRECLATKGMSNVSITTEGDQHSPATCVPKVGRLPKMESFLLSSSQDSSVRNGKYPSEEKPLFKREGLGKYNRQTIRKNAENENILSEVHNSLSLEEGQPTLGKNHQEQICEKSARVDTQAPIKINQTKIEKPLSQAHAIQNDNPCATKSYSNELKDMYPLEDRYEDPICHAYPESESDDGLASLHFSDQIQRGKAKTFTSLQNYFDNEQCNLEAAIAAIKLLDVSSTTEIEYLANLQIIKKLICNDETNICHAFAQLCPPDGTQNVTTQCRDMNSSDLPEAIHINTSDVPTLGQNNLVTKSPLRRGESQSDDKPQPFITVSKHNDIELSSTKCPNERRKTPLEDDNKLEFRKVTELSGEGIQVSSEPKQQMGAAAGSSRMYLHKCQYPESIAGSDIQPTADSAFQPICEKFTLASDESCDVQENHGKNCPERTEITDISKRGLASVFQPCRTSNRGVPEITYSQWGQKEIPQEINSQYHKTNLSSAKPEYGSTSVQLISDLKEFLSCQLLQRKQGLDAPVGLKSTCVKPCTEDKYRSELPATNTFIHSTLEESLLQALKHHILLEKVVRQYSQTSFSNSSNMFHSRHSMDTMQDDASLPSEEIRIPKSDLVTPSGLYALHENLKPEFTDVVNAVSPLPLDKCDEKSFPHPEPRRSVSSCGEKQKDNTEVSQSKSADKILGSVSSMSPSVREESDSPSPRKTFTDVYHDQLVTTWTHSQALTNFVTTEHCNARQSTTQSLPLSICIRNAVHLPKAVQQSSSSIVQAKKELSDESYSSSREKHHSDPIRNAQQYDHLRHDTPTQSRREVIQSHKNSGKCRIENAQIYPSDQRRPLSDTFTIHLIRQEEVMDAPLDLSKKISKAQHSPKTFLDFRNTFSKAGVPCIYDCPLLPVQDKPLNLSRKKSNSDIALHKPVLLHTKHTSPHRASVGSSDIYTRTMYSLKDSAPPKPTHTPKRFSQTPRAYPQFQYGDTIVTSAYQSRPFTYGSLPSTPSQRRKLESPRPDVYTSDGVRSDVTRISAGVDTKCRTVNLQQHAKFPTAEPLDLSSAICLECLSAVGMRSLCPYCCPLEFAQSPQSGTENFLDKQITMNVDVTPKRVEGSMVCNFMRPEEVLPEESAPNSLSEEVSFQSYVRDRLSVRNSEHSSRSITSSTFDPSSGTSNSQGWNPRLKTHTHSREAANSPFIPIQSSSSRNTEDELRLSDQIWHCKGPLTTRLKVKPQNMLHLLPRPSCSYGASECSKDDMTSGQSSMQRLSAQSSKDELAALEKPKTSLYTGHVQENKVLAYSNAARTRYLCTGSVPRRPGGALATELEARMKNVWDQKRTGPEAVHKSHRSRHGQEIPWLAGVRCDGDSILAEIVPGGFPRNPPTEGLTEMLKFQDENAVFDNRSTAPCTELHVQTTSPVKRQEAKLGSALEPRDEFAQQEDEEIMSVFFPLSSIAEVGHSSSSFADTPFSNMQDMCLHSACIYEPLPCNPGPRSDHCSATSVFGPDCNLSQTESFHSCCSAISQSP